MDKKIYWFITVFESMESDKSGELKGDSRCWGFFSDKDEAVKVLHGNISDLWETVYDYAVLEGFFEGICGYTENRRFFKYSMEKNGYFEIPEPECLKNLYTFAQIG